MSLKPMFILTKAEKKPFFNRTIYILSRKIRGAKKS